VTDIQAAARRETLGALLVCFPPRRFLGSNSSRSRGVRGLFAPEGFGALALRSVRWRAPCACREVPVRRKNAEAPRKDHRGDALSHCGHLAV